MLPPPPPPPPIVRVAAGWYPDPSGAPALRWWDGTGWTGHVADDHRPAEVPPMPSFPLVAAVGAALVIVASLAGSRLVLDLLSSQRLPILAYAAISAVLGYGPMVAYCWWVARRFGSGRPLDDLGLRWRPVDLGWGPVIWLSAYAAQITVAIVLTVVGVPFASNTESIRELKGERGVLIALAITAVVVAPLVEELIFRGVLLRGLSSRLPIAWAIVVQGLLFGSAHVDPSRGAGNIGLALVLSTVGVVFGGGAYLLRRIGPTIIAHALMNSVVLAVLLLT